MEAYVCVREAKRDIRGKEEKREKRNPLCSFFFFFWSINLQKNNNNKDKKGKNI